LTSREDAEVARSKTFDLGPAPELTLIGCQCDMRVQGSDGPVVELLSWQESDDVQVEEQQSSLRISARVPLTLNVPLATSVIVKGCSGDVRAHRLETLRVENHQGDLTISQVKSVTVAAACGDMSSRDSDRLDVSELNGDLSVRAVGEEATVTSVCGDVSLSGIQGRVSLRETTGDVSVRAPGGDVTIHDINGEVKLAGKLQQGQLSVESNGNVIIHLDPESSARIQIKAPLGRVRSDIELQEGSESVHALSGQIGAGTAVLDVLAHTGSVRMRRRSFREGSSRQGDERADVFARRQVERTQRLEEKWRRKSQRLEAKARETSERLVEAFETRGAFAGAGREGLGEERLAVLRMLSEGKISAAEAEALLEAMEG
jgi:hypothetical protein